MEVEMLHIVESTKYSDKQCKANTGNEFQDFKKYCHCHGHEYHAMNLGFCMYNAGGCTTEIWPEYGKH
jgi:hypothetical protein